MLGLYGKWQEEIKTILFKGENLFFPKKWGSVIVSVSLVSDFCFETQRKERPSLPLFSGAL